MGLKEAAGTKMPGEWDILLHFLFHWQMVDKAENAYYLIYACLLVPLNFAGNTYSKIKNKNKIKTTYLPW